MTKLQQLQEEAKKQALEYLPEDYNDWQITWVLSLIDKAFKAGQQDMLERVREIISDKIDGLRINNSSIFEHGDYYKKEDILKALDNLKN